MRIDENLAMDGQLYEILIKIEDRMNKKWDGVLGIDGMEGGGKTTIGTQICYTMSKLTGRPFSVQNVFFSVEKAIAYASTTDHQIIMIDEAVFDLLASEFWNPMQNLLIKLLMTARNKSHFIVLNIPKFYMLRQYIVDRLIGLVHIYSPDNLQRGYFAYYKLQQKNYVYEQWRKKKISSTIYKNYSFIGRFPKTFDVLIDEAAYEKAKNEAIANLTAGDKFGENPKIKKLESELITLKQKIAANCPGTMKEKAKALGISDRTLLRWKKGTIEGGVPDDSRQTDK